jgi:ribosomal protein S18 acetylase RimI-like enzyme
VSFSILPLDAAKDLDEVRALMGEYAETLDVQDRCFQNMDAELAGLPGAYTPPEGALLVARDVKGPVLGSISLRRLGDGVCEMKRLYVRPDAQRRGLGRALAEAIIEAARSTGYQTMRLDTLDSMAAAQALYRDLGFQVIDAYNANPTPGITYMELSL